MGPGVHKIETYEEFNRLLDAKQKVLFPQITVPLSVSQFQEFYDNVDNNTLSLTKQNLQGIRLHKQHQIGLVDSTIKLSEPCNTTHIVLENSTIEPANFVQSMTTFEQSKDINWELIGYNKDTLGFIRLFNSEKEFCSELELLTLQSLHYDGVGFVLNDQLHNIPNLTVVCPQLTVNLSRPCNVIHLSLTSCKLTDLQFTKFMPMLEQLSLYNNGLTRLELFCPVECVSIQYNVIVSFAKNEQLQNLTINSSKLRNLDFLCNFPNLTHLNVIQNYICDISGVMQCKALKQVNFQNNFIKTEQFRHLKPLKQLQYFQSHQIGQNATDQSLVGKLKTIQGFHPSDSEKEVEVQLFEMDVLQVKKNEFMDKIVNDSLRIEILADEKVAGQQRIQFCLERLTSLEILMGLEITGKE